MAQYPPALEYILQFEDPKHAYANIPDNKGNVIAGVNSLAFPADFAAIAALPQNQRAPAVAQFYQSNFWNPLRLGGLNSQDVANRVLDEAVNTGLREAAVALQEAINTLQAGTVAVDGQIGPLTLAAANNADPEALLAAYQQARAAYYQEIAANDPAMQPYLNGWLTRAQA